MTAEGREPGAGETPEAAVAQDLDALVADVKRERDEYLDLAQRTKADFENYRKRVAREAADAEMRGRASLARGLIPVVDNFERALAAAGIDPDGEEPAGADELTLGVLMVYRQLCESLAGSGVERYQPDGESFDPNLHEAMMKRPEEGVEPGVVVEVLERGYRMNSQVLRPARVVVSE